MRKALVTISSAALLFTSWQVASAQTARRSPADNPDIKELSTYTLTLDTLAKVDRANRAMVASFQKDPTAGDPRGVSAKTIADLEQKIAATPVMASALEHEGVTPREYARFTMALLQASFTLGAKQRTEKAGRPFQIPEGVNPANVTFVQEHEAELKRMQEVYAQLGPIK